MTTTGVDMVGTILATHRPTDLFGPNKDNAKTLYRRLLRSVHPDVNTDPRAEDALVKLQRLWQQMGSGDGKPISITSRKHVYELGELRNKTGIANVYGVTWDAGNDEGLMKICRSPKNNDLVAAEVRALKKLRDVPEHFQMYHPDLIDAFRYRDAATKVDRSTVVTNGLDGFYSLEQVRQAYGFRLLGRDIGWMFRRLLVGIGTAHDVGLIHGSIVPENVMILPEQHGLVLTDWTCSVERGQPLRSAAAKYRNWLSDDTRAKKPVDYRHDIRMAGRTMLTLTHMNYTPLRAFFQGCTVSSVPTAAELLAEFDELLERLYGKRAFHPFVMPTTKDG